MEDSEENVCVDIEAEGVKGEVSREFAVISKPKNVCLSTET